MPPFCRNIILHDFEINPGDTRYYISIKEAILHIFANFNFRVMYTTLIFDNSWPSSWLCIAVDC